MGFIPATAATAAVSFIELFMRASQGSRAYEQLMCQAGHRGRRQRRGVSLAQRRCISPRRRFVSVRPAQPLKAFLSAEMSSFLMSIIAAKARFIPGDFGSFHMLISFRGVTCHETPNLSFNHPHACDSGLPPSESLSQ